MKIIKSHVLFIHQKSTEDHLCIRDCSKLWEYINKVNNQDLVLGELTLVWEENR